MAAFPSVVIGFFALIILATIALMFSYFKYKLGNEQKQNELLKQRNILEKELQQSMLSSIKSQMNPHFLFNALNTLTPENLNQIIYIRNEGQTVTEAINRQLCHYSYHVGQIVFYAKMLKTSEWDSLSIPKNNSAVYNQEKFAQEKHQEHFTDAFLKNK